MLKEAMDSIPGWESLRNKGREAGRKGILENRKCVRRFRGEGEKPWESLWQGDGPLHPSVISDAAKQNHVVLKGH